MSISKQMSRFKQDPAWLGNEANIVNSGDGGDGAAATPKKTRAKKEGATPRKPRAAPKKKDAAKAMTEDNIDNHEQGEAKVEDGQDGEAGDSPEGVPPTPKGKSNKVISGRVTKSGGTRKAKVSAPKYQEDNDDLQMDSESDNSTYQLSGGEEPAGLGKTRKFRAKGTSNSGRNGSVSNGAAFASEEGNGTYGKQDEGQRDAYYDAPEGEEEENYPQY